MFDNDIETKKQEILEKTCQLINIPSVYSASNHSNYPFGKPIHEALEYFLELGKNLGFQTKNIDNYSGYIEFGSGKELVGIIGHLDVVPASNDWTHSPFSATIEDGKLYGRGAIDDKGPMIASLYAMKSVMETSNLSKRVRLIIGLDEERNWEGIEYYKKKEEIPTVAFSPDADFPCIYAEKSILTTYLSSVLPQTPIHIEEIDCENNAINVVPKICTATIQFDLSKLSASNIIQTLKASIKAHQFEIDIYQIDEQHIKLTAHGIASHSAHPNLGINAISHILVVLSELFHQYQISIELLEWFSTYIGTEYTGKALSINYSDESGPLTLNIGDVSLKQNRLSIGMNLRIPITISIETIKEKLKHSITAFSSIQIEHTSQKDKLFVSKDNEVVQLLCNIFNQYTNSNFSPLAIGGATFARAFPNCITFGPNLPNQKDMCHQKDEFISIDNLMLCAKLYAQAIYELAK